LLGGISLDVLMMKVVALARPLLSGCCESLGVPSVVSDLGELNLHDRVGCFFFCLAHACCYVPTLCLSHLSWMDGRALIGHSLFFRRLEGMHLHALACGCDCLEIHLLAAIVDFGS